MIKQILSWYNLKDAWNDVQARKGAPGVDGVSVKRWGRNWEERLVNLRQAVMANTYEPAPLERYSVPKKSGGRRHLTNLTVTDKVLQRAVLNILDNLFDPLFLPCSYGYRKGRSTADAVEAICAHRDAGFTWVLDADIDECFDSLDLNLLVKFVQEKVDDPILLRLIDSWLRVGRRDAAATLESIKLQLEPRKTNVTNFDDGFDYLGVHFERDEYTYFWEGKRITVEGDFPDFLFAYGPGYE